MSDPFIFITHHTIKDGQFEKLEAMSRDFLDFVEANEPRLLGLHAYLDRERGKLTLLQIHPDAESMDFHLQVAGDKIHRAVEIVDNDSVEVYGDPGPVTRGLLDQISAAGVRVNERPDTLGGFVRLGAA